MTTTATENWKEAVQHLQPFFLFCTAVKLLKRRSVDGITSKDVNASINTLFERNLQDAVFSFNAEICCQLHVGIKDITCSATLL